MKNKLILALTVLLLVGTLSACSLFNSPSTTAASTNTNPRTLNVDGDGKVYLVPDLAYIDIGVQTQGSNVTDALASNTTQAQAIAAALEQQGVDAKDIRTSNFSISPNQNYDASGKSTDTTYVVNNTVYVTVRDLTKLGTILGAVTTSGANVINSISFDSTKSNDATIEARKAAIADARQQAQTLATAAGVTLDSIQSISVSNNSPVTVYDVKNAAVASGANTTSSVPVSAGQILIEASANLTYTIK